VKVDKKNIERFTMLLENAGYEEALNLIKNELIPLAVENGISLWEAAWKYSNQDEEQDTSSFQLFHALQKISNKQRL
jgi:hypothetical protein